MDNENKINDTRGSSMGIGADRLSAFGAGSRGASIAE